MENGILHVDMNNFYASVETLYAPQYRDVPMAVAGDKESRHGIILAKNQLAKEKGVKTAEPIWQAMRKCPELKLLPPHHERYEDFSRRARKIYCDYTDLVEPFSLDECWLDVYGSERLFGDGEKIAYTIKERVKKELGLTVSIGVSFNKVFAKLGSDYKKPDAVTVFGRREMETVIWKMPCSAMLFVGPSAEKTLLRYGLRTIGDIAAADRALMVKIFGKLGDTLWSYANGLDRSPVRSADSREEAKSIGHSTTLPRDISSEQDVRRTFLSLSESVASALRAQSLRAGEVQITVRGADFEEYQRQCRVEPPVCDSQSIYRAAMELYKKENKRWAIRLLGVRAGRLSASGEGQTSLFDDGGRRKREKLETAVDALRERFGSGSVSSGLEVTGKNEHNGKA